VGNTPYGSPGIDRGQYGFFFGAKFGQKPGMWVIDPLRTNLQGAPIADNTRSEVLNILRGKTRPGFDAARPVYDGDAISRRLDTMSLEDHLIDKFGVSRDTARASLWDEGSGFALVSHALSAFAAYAPDMLHPRPDADAEQMFPDGNSGFARL